MNKQNLLQLQAVKAAKKLDWNTAISLNQSIIDIDPNNLGALNRMGVAYLQNKKNGLAKRAFNKALEVDNSNPIAKKHLDSIKKKKITKTPLFSRVHFIEEPGTTKIVDLHRIANKTILEKLSVSQPCSLKPKGRYLSVVTEDNEYLGALPEDLSFRLTKLMKRGNTYASYVHSITTKSCKVYIKESSRSKVNENINSFSLNKSSGHLGVINDVDDRFLLEKNIPVAIVETDKDNEKTIDDVDSSDKS
jgi:tetratricopeptide (TPR) repeat protein